MPAAEWMSASLTLAHAAQASGDEWQAMLDLRLYAKNGQLRSRARRISGTQKIELDGLFWTNWADDYGRPVAYEDWHNGRFEGRAVTGGSRHAYGVEFNVEDMRRLYPNVQIDEGRSRAGRQPAHWWPAFAEELAIYLHDEGPPPGIGSEGSEQVIDAVLARLSDRDITASRTSIQPVVVSALRRLRAPAA